MRCERASVCGIASSEILHQEILDSELFVPRCELARHVPVDPAGSFGFRHGVACDHRGGGFLESVCRSARSGWRSRHLPVPEHEPRKARRFRYTSPARSRPPRSRFRSPCPPAVSRRSPPRRSGVFSGRFRLGESIVIPLSELVKRFFAIPRVVRRISRQSPGMRPSSTPCPPLHPPVTHRLLLGVGQLDVRCREACGGRRGARRRRSRAPRRRLRRCG